MDGNKAKEKSMNEFYRKVDELCVKKGITHRALAEKIGVNEVTLSRYLLGQRTIQLMPFMGMCKALDVPVEELYKVYLYARLEQRVIRYRTEHEQRDIEPKCNINGTPFSECGFCKHFDCDTSKCEARKDQ
ncbi:MAG: helix-turn-helix transcriptional regulator [Exiguobacterium sp.]|nr:helix-turn-helix transcriptional regulator [Exiguobacterium sp.]